jgi:broad specificity phosphatase PhoE
MENGWFLHPNKETKEQFVDRVQKLTSWVWGLHEEGPSTVVLVMHGFLMSTLLNKLLLGTDRACIFIHYNTGVTHVQLTDVSGRFFATTQYQNRTDHLATTPSSGSGDDETRSISSNSTVDELHTGSDLINDSWIKIFKD